MAEKAKRSVKRKLVIVESPSKAKTIGKYLGPSYKVIASVGHVRDLPKSRIGIDIENDFEPEYINIKGKGDIIKEIKAEAKKASEIYLATDPDREGEAISMHLATILGIEPESKCRVTFNEITKDAVKTAIKQPRVIDTNLFDAQQARREVDRLVGYLISPLLWRKLSKHGLSAGRVQSAALKIICDRESEIESFIPREYWNIDVEFKEKKTFTAHLASCGGRKYSVEKNWITSEEEAGKIVDDLKKGIYTVVSVVSKTTGRNPMPPFTTSTLQQDAANKLGFSTKKTMSVVQRLYEGVDVSGEGRLGLVTYIRTDSVRIADSARAAAKDYIMSNFGSEYYADQIYVNKKKEIQDAHEAIRPTRIDLDPEKIRESLDDDQYKLYSLIWKRFIASQMASAKFDGMQVDIKNGDYMLQASGSKMIFDGYQKVYSVNAAEKDNMLPELKEGSTLDAKKVIPEKKATQPPVRFTEASLVKELEDKNIGRPSTYAPIVSTLIERQYVAKKQKSLMPKPLGQDVNKLMSEYFKEIVDCDFTSQMEDSLDEIEEKGIAWRGVVGKFYEPLKTELDNANEAIPLPEKKEAEAPKIAEGEFCEKCGSPMALRTGRFGEFLACTGFPKCRNTKALKVAEEKPKEVFLKCPDCGGDIVEKHSRRGKVFYGCTGYPECTRAFWYKPIDRKCPVCGGILVEKNNRICKVACSEEGCGYKE